jgi:hypothetical protein
LLAGLALAGGGDDLATVEYVAIVVHGTAFADGGAATAVVVYPRRIGERFAAKRRPAAFGTQERPDFTVAGRPAIGTRPDSREG